MSDTPRTPPPGPGAGGADMRGPKDQDTRAATDRAAEDARRALGEARHEAREAAGQVGDEARETYATVKQEGQALAAAAQERAQAMAEEQKDVVAERTTGVARAVHRAADDLRDASPVMADYVHEAASTIDRFSSALRSRSLGDLVGEVEDFARRQPMAFFGASVLAGFALTRFARSSAPGAGYHAGAGYDTGARRMGEEAMPRTTATGAPGWVPDDRARAGSHPATVSAATLGGAAAHGAGGTDEGQRPMSGSMAGRTMSGEELRTATSTGGETGGITAGPDGSGRRQGTERSGPSTGSQG